jgi:hypothetical protein
MAMRSVSICVDCILAPLCLLVGQLGRHDREALTIDEAIRQW